METPPQPEIPISAEHVWHWWWELNARRQPGFETLAPITYSEIHSWILLTAKMISSEEIDWLIEMDNAWLSAISQERKDRSDREKEDAERRKQGSK